MASLTDRNVRIWVGRATTAGSPVLGGTDRPLRTPRTGRTHPTNQPSSGATTQIIATPSDPGCPGRIAAGARLFDGAVGCTSGSGVIPTGPAVAPWICRGALDSASSLVSPTRG